jgi:zinc transporter ZupT
VHTSISVPLALLFVFLAGFNAWIMLSGRGASPRARRLWSQAHRTAGYTFIALFLIFLYFMLLRIRGTADELSPRLILHMSLALVLAPLLLVKVIVVRFQKSAWGLLSALGVAIFSIAFTLVAINVSVHYVRNFSPHKMPPAVSGSVIVGISILALIGFFSRSKQREPEAEAASLTPDRPQNGGAAGSPSKLEP